MLNIVFASDDNYVPLLGVAITSLIKNNQDDFDKINIFILDDEISENNKKRLEKLVDNPNHILIFIKTKKLDDLKINLLHMYKNLHISFTNYARLFMADLLPKDIDKVIYLDCDGLIVDSLNEVWNANIDDYYCGAVLAGMSDAHKQYLGFKLDDSYFNSGFLLVNLKKWRQDNVEEKFIQFMVENQNKFYQQDEGVLNDVFKDQFLILDLKYNLNGSFQILDYNLGRKYCGMKGKWYSKDIFDQAKQNPVFLHFLGLESEKPWINKKHIHRDLYRKYSEMSGFSEELPGEWADLSLTSKLIFNSVNNPLFKLILILIPASFIYKNIKKDTFRTFEGYKKLIVEGDIHPK